MHKLVPINVNDIDDGRLAKAIDDHLAIIGKNVAQYPNKTGERKVKIEITLAPEHNDTIDAIEAAIKWKVDFAVPGRKGSVSKAAIEDEMCLVNPWDSGNPQQTIIDAVANPTTKTEEPEQPENVENFAPPQQQEG